MLYQNIWGVGRNFKDHAKEMNAETPTSPMIFLKSGASVGTTPGRILLPSWTQEVHHEIELAVQIAADGSPRRATLALDLTERQHQSLAKKNGHPWTLAKSFRGATILGSWIPWAATLLETEIELQINGITRQKGSLADLIFPLDQITQYLLRHFPVCDNDVILLGTPAGVGPLKVGDRLEGRLGTVLKESWIVETIAEDHAK